MYINTFMTRLATLLLVASICGCGFQLRGAESKPDFLKNVYVAGQGEYSNFMRKLKANLIDRGITVVDNAQAADLTLTITSNSDERRTLTITRSNRIDEYQLINTVKFKVVTATGLEVVPEKPIIVERSYINNRDQIIGTEYQQDMLEKEMNQDAINQIITRLYAITEEDIANAKTPAPIAPKQKTNLGNIINQQY